MNPKPAGLYWASSVNNTGLVPITVKSEYRNYNEIYWDSTVHITSLIPGAISWPVDRSWVYLSLAIWPVLPVFWFYYNLQISQILTVQFTPWSNSLLNQLAVFAQFKTRSLLFLMSRGAENCAPSSPYLPTIGNAHHQWHIRKFKCRGKTNIDWEKED